MINQKLLKPKVMSELKAGFAENNPKGIQVQGFLEPMCYDESLKEIRTASFTKSEQRDTHSHFEAKHPALAFFRSNEFLSFASSVTGKKLGLSECSLRIFLSGSYTLLHDKPAKGIEFYFDLTPDWKTEWGGSTFLIAKEGEKLMLPPIPNTLIIAEAGKSYVKYVNCLAGGEGRLVVYGILKTAAKRQRNT